MGWFDNDLLVMQNKAALAVNKTNQSLKLVWDFAKDAPIISVNNYEYLYKEYKWISSDFSDTNAAVAKGQFSDTYAINKYTEIYQKCNALSSQINKYLTPAKSAELKANIAATAPEEAKSAVDKIKDLVSGAAKGSLQQMTEAYTKQGIGLVTILALVAAGYVGYKVFWK